MRQKKLNKKLVLNKTTIDNLTVHEMRAIYGGDPPETHKKVCPPPSSVVTSCMDC